MTAITEETGLSTRNETTGELATTAAAAEKQFEIQSAIIVARRFPRNEDSAFAKLMKACQRTSFAEDAAYSYPRGGETVEGPSVNLAREAARVWGNIRYGLEVIRDDDASRQIRGWAWDMETNTKVTAEDDFRKLVYRKKGGPNGKGGWIEPDERDLRELTNRRGAILIRNCILQVLPKDLIEDALATSKGVLKLGAENDPEGTRKRIIMAFADINVTVEMLEQKLGHKIAECSPAELADLRTIFKSIEDGNTKWADYVPQQTNGDEPKRKSENTTGTQAVEQPATPATAPAGTGQSTPADLPFDPRRTYQVVEVAAGKKKGDPFSVTLAGADGKNFVVACSDQRFYIAAQSAKQSKAQVMVNARVDSGIVILTALEEAAV